MTPTSKRIQQLEHALDDVARLLRRTDLTPHERENLVREGNYITAKIESLNQAA